MQGNIIWSCANKQSFSTLFLTRQETIRVNVEWKNRSRNKNRTRIHTKNGPPHLFNIPEMGWFSFIAKSCVVATGTGTGAVAGASNGAAIGTFIGTVFFCGVGAPVGGAAGAVIGGIAGFATSMLVVYQFPDDDDYDD